MKITLTKIQSKVLELKKKGLTGAEIMKKAKLAKSTVYNAIRRLKNLKLTK